LFENAAAGGAAAPAAVDNNTNNIIFSCPCQIVNGCFVNRSN